MAKSDSGGRPKPNPSEAQLSNSLHDAKPGLSPERKLSNRDAPPDAGGLRCRDDLRLPWRVDDSLDISARASGAYAQLFGRVYPILDRSGIAVALFSDLKMARVVTEWVNGLGTVPAGVR